MPKTFPISREYWQAKIPPQHFSWFLKIQGELTEVKRRLNYPMGPPTCKRGIIYGFSQASRMNMLRNVARINWTQVRKSSFITLTYPDAVEYASYRERAKHRYVFHRYLEKYLGKKVAMLWRTEWKPRLSGEHVGKVAPHLHLVVFECPRIPWQTIRAWWRQAIGHVGYVHTFIQAIKGADGPARYCCKYMAKDDSLVSSAYLNNPLPTGRAWGLTRPSLIPMHPVSLFCRLQDQDIIVVKRYAIERFANYSMDLGGGFTLFGAKHPEEIRSRLGMVS